VTTATAAAMPTAARHAATADMPAATAYHAATAMLESTTHHAATAMLESATATLESATAMLESGEATATLESAAATLDFAAMPHFATARMLESAAAKFSAASAGTDTLEWSTALDTRLAARSAFPRSFSGGHADLASAKAAAPVAECAVMAKCGFTTSKCGFTTSKLLARVLGCAVVPTKHPLLLPTAKTDTVPMRRVESPVRVREMPPVEPVVSMQVDIDAMVTPVEQTP
jgi:hypothetical protein